ncbi:hypothetical protein PENTCL1PPCAC_7726, partial [Pristionchus entomophagus]
LERLAHQERLEADVVDQLLKKEQHFRGVIAEIYEVDSDSCGKKVEDVEYGLGGSVNDRLASYLLRQWYVSFNHHILVFLHEVA